MEVCRLCLDLLQDTNFLQIDKNYGIIVNTVLPELNLKISNNPVACKDCTSTVELVHKFKTKCIENEQLIKQKCNGETNGELKLSLKEILHGVNLGEVVMTEKTKERICRTCLDSIEDESFTVLQPSKPDAYLDSMLNMCLPELNLTLSEGPVMCEKCLNSLQKFHQLRTTCLDVEEKLKNYCKINGTNSSAQINLHSVLEQSSLNNKEVETPTFFKVKSEPLSISKSGNSEFVPVNPEFKTGVKTEQIDDIDMETSNDDSSVKLDSVKEEEVEIKSEEEEKKASGMLKLDQIMKDVLKNHKQETHYSCSMCAFTMANKRHYVMHMLTVHTTFNEETRLMHFCHLCDFKTMYKDQMKKHIENEHMEKEKLSCPFCPFTSIYSTNLKRHISIHEDLQDLTCSHPQCDFKTSYKYSLQRHEVKIHGNQCSVCHYKNRNRSAVQKHLRTVHGIYEIHQCDKCSFKTFYLMTLKRHNAREHKGMLKPSNFSSVKKKKDELTPEEEEEIKNLFNE